MSMYGTNYDANNLYEELCAFLKEHTVRELINIVLDVLENDYEDIEL